MADPIGAADPLHDALTRDQLAALSAWADAEPSAGFADAVLDAWEAEPPEGLGADDDVDDFDFDDDERLAERVAERLGFGAHPPRVATAARPTAARAIPRGRSRSRLRSAVALSATFAAAAAVMLMIRVLPPETHAATEPDLEVPFAGSAALSDDEAAPASLEAAAGDDAVAVLVRRCSPCHDGSSSEAQEGALDVFDVRHRPWWGGMSYEQLEGTRSRVEGTAGISDDERRSVASFVVAELSSRAHAG